LSQDKEKYEEERSLFILFVSQYVLSRFGGYGCMVSSPSRAGVKQWLGFLFKVVSYGMFIFVEIVDKIRICCSARDPTD